LGALLGISRVVDAINRRIGRWVAWAILVAVIISTGNAVVRKAFDTSSNAWLEAQWYLFGAVFMLCASWTLLQNEHIRIDIVNNLFPKWLRDWIDVMGHLLFLLPFTILMVWLAIPFVWKSFIGSEQSVNAGGLVVWPAKFLILMGFVMLTAQGISELIKRLAIISGDLEDDASGGHHGAAAEAEAERLLAQAKADGIAPAIAPIHAKS
jgi:TRAP-type mannitol/chloroaromatic compound transport system permease small subunit